LEYSRLSSRLEGGDTAYKLYANRHTHAKSPFSLNFVPAVSKNPVKSVMLPGQKGLLGWQLDRFFPFPGLKISTFIPHRQ
jgi:hypothetical protein